jgi:hypothetical protein
LDARKKRRSFVVHAYRQNLPHAPAAFFRFGQGILRKRRNQLRQPSPPLSLSLSLSLCLSLSLSLTLSLSLSLSLSLPLFAAGFSRVPRPVFGEGIQIYGMASERENPLERERERMRERVHWRLCCCLRTARLPKRLHGLPKYLPWGLLHKGTE